MDSKAQVSFEYLLTIAVSMLLVIVALILAIQIGSIAIVAKTRMIESRDTVLDSLIRS